MNLVLQLLLTFVLTSISSAKDCSPNRTAIESISEHTHSMVEAAQSSFVEAGGNKKAFQQAMCFLRIHKNTKFYSVNTSGSKIKDQCLIAFSNLDKYKRDFKKKDIAPRFFLVNVCTGSTKSYFSTYGYNGIGNSKGMTPQGFHILGGHHSTRHVWQEGIKMIPLENQNSQSWIRGVVIHPALSNRNARGRNQCLKNNRYSQQLVSKTRNLYCYVYSTSEFKVTGRSAGCTALDPQQWGEVKTAIEDSSGVLYYRYSKELLNKSNYCGEGLLI